MIDFIFVRILSLCFIYIKSDNSFNINSGSQQATQQRSGRLSSVLERIKAKKLEVKEESEEMFNSLLSCTTASDLKPASDKSLSLETDSDTRLDIDLLLNQYVSFKLIIIQ